MNRALVFLGVGLSLVAIWRYFPDYMFNMFVPIVGGFFYPHVEITYIHISCYFSELRRRR